VRACVCVCVCVRACITAFSALLVITQHSIALSIIISPCMYSLFCVYAGHKLILLLLVMVCVMIRMKAFCNQTINSTVIVVSE